MLYAARFKTYRDRLAQRSEAIPRTLERLTISLTIGWAGVLFLAACLRILSSPRFAPDPQDWFGLLGPYALIALAPLAGFVLGEACFPPGARVQPRGTSLSYWGRWRKLKVGEAQLHPLFGPAGFIASLLIGLLLNVGMRSFEFLIAIPALTSQAPHWGRELFVMMGASVGLMAFIYMIAFAFALHSVTLFPRMLGFAWLLDILIQMMIAQRIGALPDVPTAVAAPLADLLRGNITKVLISALVWLPYLILSERVNVTYRHRTSLPDGRLAIRPIDEPADREPD